MEMNVTGAKKYIWMIAFLLMLGPTVVMAQGVLNHIEVHVGSRVCVAALGTGGTIARALATTAIIFLAFSAFFGKINLMQIMIVVGAIGLTFSAAAVVDMFSGVTFFGLNSTFSNCAVAVWEDYLCGQDPASCASGVGTAGTEAAGGG